jgi:chromosome segregation protein
VTTRALADAEHRLKDIQTILLKNGEQQQSLHQRIDQTQQELGTEEEQKKAVRASEAEVNEKIDQVQQLIEPAEADLQSQENDYSRLQEDMTAAQQATSVAERYNTQAQLEVTRQREAIASLQRRIEEDFGLVSFEYATELSGANPLPFDGMVEQLPVLKEISPEIEENINRQRSQLRRMGAVNPEALTEYNDVKERYDFLTNQVEDLRKADSDLRQVIAELDELMKREFKKTFDAVSIEFKQMFTRLFGGGSAHLEMTDGDNPTETGIDIEARLPGRREQGLSLLSGGERSLTAVALIFALLKVSPTPFCVMDEVDAMLDEANVGRFRDLLMELSEKTQFIVITHNRNTVQAADVVYGITMGHDSASQVVSLSNLG